MKYCKAVSLIIVFIMIMTMAFPVAAEISNCSTPVSLTVTSSKISLYENSDGQIIIDKSNADGDIKWFKYTIPLINIKMEAVFSDGSKKEYTYSDIFNDKTKTFYINDDQSASTPWEKGLHYVTVGYLGAETRMPVSVVESPVKAITVHDEDIELYEKVDGSIVYDNSTGSAHEWFCYSVKKIKDAPVTIEFTNGTSRDYTSFSDIVKKLGFTPTVTTDQSFNKQWGLGENKAVYKIHNASYEVEVDVIENPVLGIELASEASSLIENVDGEYRFEKDLNGNNIEYFYYNTSLCKFKIKVNYKNGTSKIISEADALHSDYQILLESTQGVNNIWLPGKHNVTLSYMGYSVNAEINIVENKNSSIEIVSMPKSFYYTDEFPDLTGVVIRIQMNDNTYKDITLNNNVPNWTPKSMLIDGKKLTCSMEGNEFSITYLDFKTTKKLDIRKAPEYLKAQITESPYIPAGNGMNVILTDTNGNEESYSVLATDIISSDKYVKTDKGIFKNYNAYETYSKEELTYIHHFFMRGVEFTMDTNNKVTMGEKAVESMTYLLMLSGSIAPENLYFDGVCTEDNVNSIIKMCMYVGSNLGWRPAYSKAQIESVVNRVVRNPVVNIELSDYYDSEADLYECDLNTISGYYFVEAMSSRKEYSGGYTVEIAYSKTDTNGVPDKTYTVFVTFDKNGKIKTISENRILPCDIDNNGRLNTVDLIKMKLYLKQLAVPSRIDMIRADVTETGRISTVDIIVVKLLIKNLIS